MKTPKSYLVCSAQFWIKGHTRLCTKRNKHSRFAETSRATWMGFNDAFVLPSTGSGTTDAFSPPGLFQRVHFFGLGVPLRCP